MFSLRQSLFMRAACAILHLQQSYSRIREAKMYDAIVIGGGVVGNATAYHLVSRGAKTLLIDRHDQGRATDAGAGILSPETSASEADTWFNFAVEAVNYYPILLEQLQNEGAGETGYARCGMLTVAVSEDEVAA